MASFTDHTTGFVRAPERWATSLAIFVGFFALYAALAMRVAAGDLYEYWNLAFDLDTRRFAEAIARAPDEWAGDTKGAGVKHPLFFLLQPFSLPFRLAGFDWKQSAALTAALFGAGAATLAFGYLRAIALPRLDAALFTVFYGVSAAQLFNAFIVDSYVFSLFGLALAWTITAHRVADPAKFRRLAFLPPVYNFGVTVTNIIQTFIAEAAARFKGRTLTWGDIRVFAVSMIRFGLWTAAIIAILMIVFLHDALFAIAQDPVGSLKKLYWMQTKGPVVGADHVARTFFAFAFVAPEATSVELPGGVMMTDFRSFAYGAVGLAALALWAALLALGVYGAWKTRKPDPLLTIALLGAVAFNFLFHLKYQYRGSVFLYAAHINFVIFALAAPAWFWAASRGIGALNALRAGLVALALLTAANNLPRAWTIAGAFDNVVLTNDEQRRAVNARD